MARSLLRAVGLSAALGLGLAALAPQAAQAETFTSLYHRPDLKWYTIETEHFLVHYPVSRKSKDKTDHYLSGEWAARKVAKVSEQYWEPMCKEFDYYLQEKVNIVLLEHADQLQGFTIPARNWVEISGNPGGTFYRLRGRSEWFSNVLVHEFAHVVSLKRNQSMAENIPGLVASALYTNDALGTPGEADVDTTTGVQIFLADRTEPWWWTEGGAEYWSSRAGYNWWSTARDRHLRNTILEDRALTYQEWKSRQSNLTWGDGERGYQQGHSIALYMRMRFGQSLFAELANEHDRGWRAHWETMIEEKTGVKAKQLYDDWKAWVEDYYDRVYDDVRAEGEAKGRDLTSVSASSYEFKTPADRDAFFTDTKKVWGNEKKKLKRRRDWERAKDATGRYDVWPKYSEDGKWLADGYAYGFLQVTELPERMLGAQSSDNYRRPENADARRTQSRMTHTYPTAFGTNYDFVPGKDQLVISVQENQLQRSLMNYYAVRVERDGYNWNQLAVLDLKTRTDTEKHMGEEVEFETLRPKKQRGSHFNSNYRQRPKQALTPIPNTQRGTDPSVSPDGKRIAYIEYHSGTHNLVLINMDGSDKRYLTKFESGEMLQSLDWSPDGTEIVFALFKNYQGDLWRMDVASGEATPINQDSTEELDVSWSKHDGNIYFSSDISGVYNAFRYEPESGRIQQLTNVIGAAYTPSLTPGGDLMYMNVTAFGEKSYIIGADELLEKDVTDEFGLEYDQARADAYFAYTEDLSEFEEMTTPYQGLRRFHPPAVIPIFQLRNPSLPSFTVQTGAQVSSFDVGEKHEVFAVGLVGTNLVAAVGYTWRGWHPELAVFAQHVESKTDFGYLIDADDDKSTTDDQQVTEYRQNVFQNALGFNGNYPLNDHLRLRFSASLYEFGFRGIADKKFSRFNVGAVGRVGFEFSNMDFGLQIGRLAFSARGINPTGRYVTVDYTHGFTDHVSQQNDGVYTDDGQRLDKYNYNTVQARWTEHLPFPVRSLRRKAHKLQFDLQLGAIDRNVALFDELRINSGHPMTGGVGSGAVQPSQPLSGYPGVLLGETMAVGSAYWRMPLIRGVNEKFGPFLVRDVYVQWGGSAGNFWSFRPPEEEDVGKYYYDDQSNRIAYDPKDVRREIPFYDSAYKNSPADRANYLLADVSAEIRVSTLLMNNGFNSFLRVSYGFNEVGGIFDINGDDINDTSNSGAGNAIANETEKPGPRIYLGIGSGW